MQKMNEYTSYLNYITLSVNWFFKSWTMTLLMSKLKKTNLMSFDGKQVSVIRIHI